MAIIKDGSRNVELTGKDKEEYIKHRFPKYYKDDLDTQALLEDEEFNQNKNEVFLYLEDLKESGQTNMFGAAAFIQADFECSKNMSIRYLSEWMRSYKGENNDNN